MKRTEKKHNDIIEAAVAEFGHYGFEGARTARIAEAADVSTRTLYKHFPTKEALFNKMVDIMIQETGAIQSTPYDPSKSIKEQLINSMRVFLSAITDQKYMRLNRMVMSEYLRDQQLAQRIFAQAEMYNNPVKAIIEGGIKDGKLKDIDPQYGISMLLGPAKMLYFWPQFLIGIDGTETSDAALEDCVDMFLAKFGTNSES